MHVVRHVQNRDLQREVLHRQREWFLLRPVLAGRGRPFCIPRSRPPPPPFQPSDRPSSLARFCMRRVHHHGIQAPEARTQRFLPRSGCPRKAHCLNPLPSCVCVSHRIHYECHSDSPDRGLCPLVPAASRSAGQGWYSGSNPKSVLGESRRCGTGREARFGDANPPWTRIQDQSCQAEKDSGPSGRGGTRAHSNGISGEGRSWPRSCRRLP